MPRTLKDLDRPGNCFILELNEMERSLLAIGLGLADFMFSKANSSDDGFRDDFRWSDSLNVVSYMSS
jgi:hypothetical protein